MIGDWDNSECTFAILPACLKLGDDPDTFGVNIGSDIFPIYAGENCPSGMSMEFFNYIEYNKDEGAICNRGNTWGMGALNYQFTNNKLLSVDDLTREFWVHATAAWGSTAPNFMASGATAESTYYYTWIGFTSIRLNTWWGSSVVSSPFYPPKRIAKNSYLSNDRLYHVVVVKNGSSVEYYIDGVKETNYFVKNTFTQDLDITYSQPSVRSWTISSSTVKPAGSFKIYSVIEYKRALTDTEVLTQYNLGPSLGGLRGFNIGGVMQLIGPEYHGARVSLHSNMD